MAFDEAYDKIDRHLRNTLDDTDYAEFSVALDEVCQVSHASALEGWKLVPVEPTIEMIEEGNEGFRSPDSRRHTVSSCYKAMLAAAPTPPVSEDRWMLIETAPKDGTSILCWCDNNAEICWSVQKHGVGMVWMTDNCVDFGGYESPTHWMPLPEAPAMKEDKP